ncbi:heterokaryon incompatibility protein-domain-containing protein [Usnea florida]
MSSAVEENLDTLLTYVDQLTEDDYFGRHLIASSGWQDDLCMEPITPVPGFSELCNACIKIFRDYPIGPSGKRWIGDVRHIRYSAVLASSARRGCRLCALLLTDIQKRASCLQIAMKSIIDLHFSTCVGGVPFELSFSGTELSSWRFTLSMYPVKGQVSARNNLMSNQSLAKRWFLSCTTTHSRCRPRPCDTNFPTRLLEIDGSEKHTSVRIVMTDKDPRAGDYMTLSHCWGAAQFITLRKDNLAELGQGIQLERLPKTFQDAVAVAQWFEIRYLWIDSLCILQDSKEDWVKESATMRSVYSHSIMNISATGAVDPSIGCFLDRQSDNIRPFSALVSDSEFEHICWDDNFWRVNISEASLSKRAWAFQERLLSPRILHFGAIQMAWECMESASCETFPEGIPKPIEQTPSVISVVTKRQLFDRTRGVVGPLWKELISYYTNCALTVPSDIYMAFAGVVEEIQSLTADEYFAGFWRKGLELQLPWHRTNSATWKPTGYRAPSWSWFSINGAVHFPLLPIRAVLYKVLDVIVQNSAEGLYGPVTYGRLRCQGILGTAVRKTRDQHWIIQTAHGQGFKSQAPFLWDHKTDLSKREVTYLPVLDVGYVVALLLEPTHVKEGEFQRIGTWSIRGEDNCRSILREQMPENGVWVDRPQQIFTIV